MKKKQISQSVTRRRVLKGLGAALGTAALGCSDGTTAQATFSAANGVGGSGGLGSGGSGGGVGGVGGIGQGGAGGQGGMPGSSCTDNGGLSPQELLAPIQNIVVLMMENRSFDHYLGSLSLNEGKAVNGLTGTESNPDPNGMPIGSFLLDNFTPDDPPHGWDASHAQWNMGANDGFVIEHAGSSQNEVMGYHVRSQLPILYALADASAICERWFCSLLGPTWPNRFYLHGATSKGNKSNTPVANFTSVFELLNNAGKSNKNYFHDVAWCSGGYFKLNGLAGIETFFSDAQAGKLPAFSIIDPQFFGAGANDDHPDHNVQLGQALIASIYNALAQSPQWNQCLFILTYDEHGGFFDHVPPPFSVDDNPEFAQLGFRIPSIVAGPYVRKGCVVDTLFEHVSVIKTLTTRFGLPLLNNRVNAASDVSSCIDPAFLSQPQPPVILPPLNMSLSKVLSRPQRGIHQPELWAMAEQGLIPKHLDRRHESDEITKRVLLQAERLGAVRLID